MQGTVFRGALVLTIVSCQLAITIYHLAVPSSFCQDRFVAPLIDLVIWLCWNTVLLTLLIDAHSTNLIPGKEATATAPARPPMFVFDLPLRPHLPKLLIWIPCTGALRQSPMFLFPVCGALTGCWLCSVMAGRCSFLARVSEKTANVLTD